MATASHAPSPSRSEVADAASGRRPDALSAGSRGSEGRVERVASWLIVYLTALLVSLTVAGSAWALGLAG